MVLGEKILICFIDEEILLKCFHVFFPLFRQYYNFSLGLRMHFPRVSSLYQKFNTPTYTLPCESLQKLIDGAALQINGPNNDFGRVVKQLFQSALMVSL